MAIGKIQLIIIIIIIFAAGYLFGRNSVVAPVVELPSNTVVKLPNVNKPINSSPSQHIAPPNASQIDVTYAPLSSDCKCDNLDQLTETIDPFTEFQKLLAEHYYDDAMGIYDEQVGYDSDVDKKFKTAVIEHLQGLMNASGFSATSEHDRHFIDLTEVYLQSYYNDISVILMLANYNAQKGFVYESLDTLYLALNYAVVDTKKADVIEQFSSIKNHVDSSLSNKESWQELVEFYKTSDNYNLLLKNDKFRLVELLIYLDDWASAEPYIEQLRNDPAWLTRIDALVARYQDQNTTDQGPSVPYHRVPLRRYGDHFAVPLNINGEAMQLILDTGASITALDKRYFDQIEDDINARLRGSSMFNTANGLTRGNIYRVDNIRLGRFVIRQLDIAVLDMGIREETNGLLGMNILRNYRFQIDQDNAVLLLIPRES